MLIKVSCKPSDRQIKKLYTLVSLSHPKKYIFLEAGLLELEFKFPQILCSYFNSFLRKFPMELKPFTTMSDAINLTSPFVSADHRLWAINSLCYLETTSCFKPSKGSIFQRESACNIKLLFSSKQSIKHYCLSVCLWDLASTFSCCEGFQNAIVQLLC